MSIFVANHSSYPRIGDRPEQQELRRAIDRWEKREISDDELEQTVCKVLAEVVREQEKAGVDLVTDGQVRWYDPVSHWLKTLKGVKIGGLLRFFDTNFYFRVPKINRPLEQKDFPLVNDFEVAARASKKKVKAVLTGPITLALLSERGEGYESLNELISDLTKLLGRQVAALAAGGAGWIQIEEPMILRKPEFFGELSSSLKIIKEKKGKSKLLLTTYFGDASPYYQQLQEFPVDGLGLDCICGSELVERIVHDGTKKVLSLGLIDGRSTRLEKKADVMRPLKRILAKIGDRVLHLTSSCGLEYLPREAAFKKLTLLALVRNELS